MFHQFSNINGVTDVLHPVYRDQVNQSIKQAGPLLYVLEVYERFEKHSSSPCSITSWRASIKSFVQDLG